MRKHGRTFHRRFAVLLILVAGLAAALPILASVSANAQDQVIRRKWSLFDTFAPRRSPRFNEAERYTFPPPPRAARKNAVAKPRKSKSRVVAPQAPEEPKIAVVEKQPSARTILVIGDFLASGLAEGLDTAFAQNAGIRILDRSRGSSGIVRDDVFDWSKELAAIIEADKPAAIAIMIGSNDRQQMLVNGQRETLRSEAWTDAYEDRTEALAKAVADTKLPFVWVSMPAFKSAKMTSDMLAFNEIYKTSALASGGEYVDVWDGFVDETGAFVSTGPDVSGQSVRLRSGDGINMTSAGKTKLAFYTEKPLRKLLGLPCHRCRRYRCPRMRRSCRVRWTGPSRWRSTTPTWTAQRNCWALRPRRQVPRRWPMFPRRRRAAPTTS